MRSTRTRNRKLTCTKQDAAERKREKESERERDAKLCDVMKTSEMYAMEMHFEAAALHPMPSPLK